MNINGIAGFNQLSPSAKGLFVAVYAKHRMGVEDKEAWKAVRVEESNDHVKVNFKNGQALKFGPLKGADGCKIL